MACFSGRADCWRPEWSDSYLGSEDWPQWTADSRARGLNQLRSHWPRCQLHGSGQQLGQYQTDWQGRVLWSVKVYSTTKTAFFDLLNRETVMCGTSLEASEMKWLSSFPKLRSLHTNATPSAASSALIQRECPSPLHATKLYLPITSNVTVASKNLSSVDFYRVCPIE